MPISAYVLQGVEVTYGRGVEVNSHVMGGIGKGVDATLVAPHAVAVAGLVHIGGLLLPTLDSAAAAEAHSANFGCFAAGALPAACWFCCSAARFKLCSVDGRIRNRSLGAVKNPAVYTSVSE